MARFMRFLLFAAVLVSAACGSPAPSTLLRIGDMRLTADDFADFLLLAHPGNTLPLDRAIIANYLNEYYEHTLLVRAALDRRYELKEADDRFLAEQVLISEFLNREVYGQLTVDENRLAELYQQRYTEPRVRIQSIFFRDAATAQAEMRNLARRPDQFENLMDRYNPQPMKNAGMGQGLFNRFQVPEPVRDAIFPPGKTASGIVGPVDIGNGLLVIRIVEHLGPPSLEEVRQELEALLEPAERERLRNELLQSLGRQYEIELHREVVLENSRFVLEPKEGEK
jgi:hypothetical protein